MNGAQFRLGLFTSLVTDEVARVDDLYAILKRVLDEKGDALLSKEKETMSGTFDSEATRYSYDGWFEDQRVFHGETMAIAYGLSLLGLYRIVELNTVGLVIESGVEIRNQSMPAVVEGLRDAGIDVLDLASARHVDELRCLANCVKHSNTVSASLARYADWKRGQSLTGLDLAFERLREHVQPFLLDLYARLEPLRTRPIRSA